MCHSQTRFVLSSLIKVQRANRSWLHHSISGTIMEMPSTSVAPTKVKDVILLPLSKQSSFVNSGCFFCQRIAEARASLLKRLLGLLPQIYQFNGRCFRGCSLPNQCTKLFGWFPLKS